MRYSARNRLHLPCKKDNLSILPLLGKGACKPGGDVPEIADWLGRLGLGQYAQRFADHEIDVSVLPHLTDQDLKDIGVPLGHRRKILAAINAETGTTNTGPEPAPTFGPK